MTKTLGYWFDYSCPYAYLGSLRVAAMAERAGATLTWEPMLLGGVFAAVGTDQKLFATLGPAKAAHNAEDLRRWADVYGAPLTMPEGHPIRTVDALRATILTDNDPKVIAGFFRAYWAEHRSLAERATLEHVLSAAGHDAASILARLPEAKDDLRARTERAVSLGIFGAPAYEVNGRIYFGQDRAHLAESALRGVRAPMPGAPDDPDRRTPVPATPTRKHTLEVFFDVSSPFTYLGLAQVPAMVARTGCEVIYRPMLLGGLFRTIGQVDVPMMSWPAAKQRYASEDMKDWASYWGTPFQFPSRFPTMSLKAMRLYLGLDAAARDGYRDAVFRAYWFEDRDITDEAVLRELLGPHADAAFAAAQTAPVKDALKNGTDEAARRQVFGAPTFIVDGEQLFWGQDRLGLVESALRA